MRRRHTSEMAHDAMFVNEKMDPKTPTQRGHSLVNFFATVTRDRRKTKNEKSRRKFISPLTFARAHNNTLIVRFICFLKGLKSSAQDLGKSDYPARKKHTQR